MSPEAEDEFDRSADRESDEEQHVADVVNSRMSRDADQWAHDRVTRQMRGN